MSNYLISLSVRYNKMNLDFIIQWYFGLSHNQTGTTQQHKSAATTEWLNNCLKRMSVFKNADHLFFSFFVFFDD